jgi:hypothetical protein
MKLYFFLLNVLVFILSVPIKLYTFGKVAHAYFTYERKTLTLEKRYRVGTHVEGVSCRGKFIILHTKEIKRKPCPSWYKTTVAVKPNSA